MQKGGLVEKTNVGLLLLLNRLRCGGRVAKEWKTACTERAGQVMQISHRRKKRRTTVVNGDKRSIMEPDPNLPRAWEDDQ